MTNALVTLLAAALAFTPQNQTSSHRAKNVDERAAAVTWYLSFVDCLKIQSVKLGILNKREARAVVLQAEASCQAELARFSASMLEGSEPSETDQRVVKSFVATAEGEAETNLIVGREGGCGTVSSNPKLRCFSSARAHR